MIVREHINRKITGRDKVTGSSLNKDANYCIVDWERYHDVNRTYEKTLDSLRILFREGKIRIPETRIYMEEDSVVFRRLRRPFGGLSNKAKGYQLSVNGIIAPTAEALFQACRYTSDPEKQGQVLTGKSVYEDEDSEKFPKFPPSSCRDDWFLIREKVMYWCLKVKLIQHPETFGRLLLSTGNRYIVNHNPESDTFWGVVRHDSQPGLYEGENHLGILLMKLRDELVSTGENIMVAEPPDVPEFYILGKVPETISGKFDKS